MTRSSSCGADAASPSSAVVSLPPAQMLQSLLRLDLSGEALRQPRSLAANGVLLQQAAGVLVLLRAQFLSKAAALEAYRICGSTTDSLPLEEVNDLLESIDQLLSRVETLNQAMTAAAE